MTQFVSLTTHGGRTYFVNIDNIGLLDAQRCYVYLNNAPRDLKWLRISSEDMARLENFISNNKMYFAIEEKERPWWTQVKLQPKTTGDEQ